jgi:integrase
MSLWKRGRQYWTDFTVNGRRYRKRLGTTNLRVATRREREMIEEAGHGRLPADEQGPKRLSEAIDAYLTAKRIRCSARTIELEEERLSIVKKHFGDVPLSAITATAIADFQRARHDAGIANRTINMDVGVLSRVLKFCGRWRALADHVKNLPERQRPIGRALTAEERRRLFDVAASNPEWEHVYCAAIVAANTSMRPVEVKHIRRCDVDLIKRLLHVRRSKNETSHRVIPLNTIVTQHNRDLAYRFARADAACLLNALVGAPSARVAASSDNISRPSARASWNRWLPRRPTADSM